MNCALTPRKTMGNASAMALDASVVRHISRDIKERVRGIDVDGGGGGDAFKLSEFATKIAGLMNTAKDDEAGIFKTVPSRYCNVFDYCESS